MRVIKCLDCGIEVEYKNRGCVPKRCVACAKRANIERAKVSGKKYNKEKYPIQYVRRMLFHIAALLHNKKVTEVVKRAYTRPCSVCGRIIFDMTISQDVKRCYKCDTNSGTKDNLFEE